MAHTSMVHYIESHPLVALVVAGSHLALAETLEKIELPVIVMQLFQVGAWTVTICVGLVSLYGAWKRRR